VLAHRGSICNAPEESEAGAWMWLAPALVLSSTYAGVQQVSLCDAGGACAHNERACSTPGRFIKVGRGGAQCCACKASLRPQMRRHGLLEQLGSNNMQIHYMMCMCRLCEPQMLQHVSELSAAGYTESISLKRMLLPSVMPRHSLLDHIILPWVPLLSYCSHRSGHTTIVHWLALNAARVPFIS